MAISDAETGKKPDGREKGVDGAENVDVRDKEGFRPKNAAAWLRVTKREATSTRKTTTANFYLPLAFTLAFISLFQTRRIAAIDVPRSIPNCY